MAIEEKAITEAVPVGVNPFADRGIDERLNAGTVEIESQRAVMEVQAALLIAKRFPRNKALAYEKVLATCSREEFANSATYTYPRGGQTVTGPSIRLAEELARGWGNVEFGIRELAEYEDGTEVEAYCWDVEQNVRSKQTFRNPHERHTKQGVTKLTDPRDVYEVNANMGARRLRSRILAIIPPDMVSAALNACRQTLAGNSEKPLSEKVGVIVRKFGALGITVTHIETRFGHELGKMLPEEYVDLVGIYNSLKDDQSKPSDWFAVPKAQGASEDAQKAEAALKGGKKGEAQPSDDARSAVIAKAEALAKEQGSAMDFSRMTTAKIEEWVAKNTPSSEDIFGQGSG